MITIGRSYSGAEFAFQLMNESEFADERKRFRLTDEDFLLLNPNTETCPVFRSVQDAELTKNIYRRIPLLWREDELGQSHNPWGISLSQGLYNMTADSDMFRDRSDRGMLPLYEAKMVHHFDHRWGSYVQVASGLPEIRLSTDTDRTDPRFESQPRFWVDAADVESRALQKGWTRPWFIGWRDVALASVERTVIAAVIPRVGVGHKMPLVLFPNGISAPQASAWLANMSALILDYVARQKLSGTTLAYFVLKQLPVLPPTAYSVVDLSFIVPRVLELTYTAHDLTPWARDLGYAGEPFPWDPVRRAILRAELECPLCAPLRPHPRRAAVRAGSRRRDRAGLSE